MKLRQIILKIKRQWFEAIRRRRITRILQDLRNYLTNIEVKKGLPDVQRVLVLSPHPDDESIGCGGTLHLLAKSKAHVDVAFLTSGCPEDNPSMGETRRTEAKAAAQLLGISNVKFLGGQDGDLHLQPWLSQEVADLIKEGTYDLVFCPWPYDGHSDHSATFHLLKTACEENSLNQEIWLYEVWAPLIANRVVNIESVIHIKQAAIRAHASQVKIYNYPELFTSLARYRSMMNPAGTYAEAFLSCHSEDLSGFSLDSKPKSNVEYEEAKVA